MRPEHQAASKIEDFDPLVPYDAIRSPQQRGTDDVQLGVVPPLEPKEMPESEIEEHKAHADVPQAPPTDQEQQLEKLGDTHADVPEKSVDRKTESAEEQEETHADFPDYKGDVNAPIE